MNLSQSSEMEKEQLPDSTSREKTEPTSANNFKIRICYLTVAIIILTTGFCAGLYYSIE